MKKKELSFSQELYKKRFSRYFLVSRTNIFAKIFILFFVMWIIGLSVPHLEILARVGGIVLIVFIALWISWIISRVMH